MTQQSIRSDKIFSGVMQTIIAAGIVWMATEINKIDVAVAKMQEKTQQLEDMRPQFNDMQLRIRDMGDRLIRVEDNQHRVIKQ